MFLLQNAENRDVAGRITSQGKHSSHLTSDACRNCIHKPLSSHAELCEAAAFLGSCEDDASSDDTFRGCSLLISDVAELVNL